MEKEIVNKVAQSDLHVFDLEDYFPDKPIVNIDIAQWLSDGIVLKEKEFRAALQAHDWASYTDKLIALQCSTDAILPSWAMMLVAAYLTPYSPFIFQGNHSQTLIGYYVQKLENIDFATYQDKAVIIKGCAKKPIPEEVYVLAIQKMITFARSIMFGEACSAVPIFKRKK